MLRQRFVWSAALWMGLSAWVFAVEPNSDSFVATINQKFDNQVVELRDKYEADVEALDVEFLAKLESQLKIETDKGQLDNVLALKNERARVENDQPPTDKAETARIVLTLRGARDQKVKAAKARYERGVKQAHRERLAAVDQLIKEETKIGHLEAAVAIRHTRKELEKLSLPLSVDDAESSTGKGTAARRSVEQGPSKIDWAKVISSPAQIKIVDISPIALASNENSQPFTRVPEMFSTYKTTIYAQPKNTSVNSAELTVLKEGYLIVACDYGYQGDEAPSWTKTRWTVEQFLEHGWYQVDDREVGGTLVKDVGQTFSLFIKQVRQGEELRLRCNKLKPPYVISFEAGQAAKNPIFQERKVIPASTVPVPEDSNRKIDWTKVVPASAKVQVAGIDPSPLILGQSPNPFTQIPEIFTKHRAIIHARPKATGGIADITVLADGFLIVACNYGYQGNRYGNWQQTRWTAEQFVEHGWRKITSEEAGGTLSQAWTRDASLSQELFVKHVRQGEELRLRCNKYHPPYVILFQASEAK